MKRIILVACFGMTMLISLKATADSVDALVTTMSQKLADMSALNESIIRGGMRIRLCQHCHGKDGISVIKNVPNLAQQNPVYLLTQFEYFRTDKRKNKIMNELAKGLTDEERINIALYYSSQEPVVKPSLVKVSSLRYRRGEEIYKAVCINCHGDDGKGKQSLPRVAGQNIDFLTSTLSAYKENKALRPSSPMLAVAEALSREDINSIAAYVSIMK